MRYAIVLLALLVLGCETVEHHYHYGADAAGDVAAADVGAALSEPGEPCDVNADCVPSAVCMGGGDWKRSGLCVANECSVFSDGTFCFLTMTDPPQNLGPACQTDDDCRR